jgi:hypothetical protein
MPVRTTESVLLAVSVLAFVSVTPTMLPTRNESWFWEKQKPDLVVAPRPPVAPAVPTQETGEPRA